MALDPTRNSIGEFQFIALQGLVPTIAEEVSVLVRPGVAGVGLLRTGRRSPPFRLTSQVDVATFADTRTTLAAYRALMGADPVALVWEELLISETEEVLVAVLNCDLIDARAIRTSVNGINAPSTAWLVCAWDLVLINNAPES